MKRFYTIFYQCKRYIFDVAENGVKDKLCE